MMNLPKNIKAQSTIEFTFAVIAIMFLIYGMIQVFRWAGMDLANRRFIQDNSITKDVVGGDPSSQLNFDDDGVLPVSAVYRGTVAQGNTK